MWLVVGGNLIEMVLWYYHFDGAMNNNHEHVLEDTWPSYADNSVCE